ETQPACPALEDARPDLLARQSLLRSAGVADLIEPEQQRPADQRPAGLLRQSIEARRVLREARSRFRRPCAIEQRALPDRDRRPRYRPGTGQLSEQCDVVFGAQRKAEAHTGKAIEFPEGTQDQQSRPPCFRSKREAGNDIGKALVDDKAPDPRR